MSSLFSHLRPPSQRHNLQTLRNQPLSELSGSLGDLGTLLPILIALTLTKSISLSTTLVFTGLSNILTGLFFSIPLPVQPMKAIAAVAIARKFTKDETASAGLFVGGVIGIASITGILGWIGRVVPIPVVKGIQVGAGLSLVLSAGSTLLQPLGWIRPSAGDNLIWALGAFIFLLITTAPWMTSSKGIPRIPYALAVFLIGLIIAFITYPAHVDAIIAPWRPHLSVPSGQTFLDSALSAGLGQLPLTTLNSIIAVTHLSGDLFPPPNNPTAPSPTSLGISVAAMNLISCWFGGMPTCHGAGGLAAQHRFGARSGASVIILGLFKLVLGLVFSEDALVGVLEGFPRSLLGIMVIAAGVQLAGVGEGLNAGARDLWIRAEEAEGQQQGEEAGTKTMHRTIGEQERKERWMVMMLTVAGLLAFKNDAVGFLAGLLCHWSIKAPVLISSWRQGRKEGSSGRFGGGTDVNEESVGLLADRRDD